MPLALPILQITWDRHSRSLQDLILLDARWVCNLWGPLSEPTLMHLGFQLERCFPELVAPRPAIHVSAEGLIGESRVGFAVH